MWVRGNWIQDGGVEKEQTVGPGNWMSPLALRIVDTGIAEDVGW